MLNLCNLNALKNLERGSGGKGFLAKNLTFNAPLTNSLFASGKGSTTPTFTRATTATYTDHEACVRDVLSGEARFMGARRIRNQFPYSQDFTQSGTWIRNVIDNSTFTGVADPFGGTTAMKLVTNNGSSVIGNDSAACISQIVTKTESVAQTLMFSIYAKAGESYELRLREATTFGYRVVFNLVTGSITYEVSSSAANYNSQMQDVGNGWYRCSVRYVTGSGATQRFDIKASGAGTSTTGDGVSGLYLAYAQLEDITAKDIQAPSEYVSTNVTSAPFHGANVDGVKYSNEDVLVRQNLARYSADLTNTWAVTEATVALAGETTPEGEPAYFLVDNGVSSSHRLALSTDVPVTGLSYTATAYIKAGTKDTAVFRLVDGPFAQGGRMHISSISAMTYTEVVSGTSTMTSSMTDVGNGWRKLTINVVFPSTVSLPAYIIFYTGADTNLYVGTGQNILCGSVQLRQNHVEVESTYLTTTSRALQYVTGTVRIPSTTTLGYLSELAGTNLLQRSEEFDNASWLKTDTTITANNIASPDGYQTADLCTEGVAGTASLNQGSAAYTANNPVSFSVYLKRGNTDWIRVTQTGNATPADSVRAWFNLATGAKGTVLVAGAATQGASTIQALKGGWYRCTVTYLPNAAETVSQIYFMSASADGNTTRVNNATYYVWGAQCEIGFSASSYIPTAGTTVTRNSDALLYPGTDNAANAVGTAYAEATWITRNSAASRIVAFSGGAGATPLLISTSQAVQSADGTTFLTTAGSLNQFQTYKTAVTFGGVTRTLGRQGGTTLYDQAYDGDYTTGVTNIGIGVIGSSNQFGGCVRNVKLYKVKISNDALDNMIA